MKGIYVHACVCMYMHKHIHMCIQRTQIRLFLVNLDLGIFYGIFYSFLRYDFFKMCFSIPASTIFNLKKTMANRCN